MRILGLIGTAWTAVKLVRNAISLFITYRPLLLAVVAAIHAAIAATAKGSKGGKYITPAERLRVNNALWEAYDIAMRIKR